MDLNPSFEQRQLVEAFSTLYRGESTTERVRAAEATGFDPGLWEALAGAGGVEMALPLRAGGSGASLLDLALVAEVHGRHLGSAPLVEAQVSARLLERLGGAAPVVADVAAGRQILTVALAPPGSGTARGVPAAMVADAVLVLDDRCVALVGLADARTPVHNLAALPLADVRLDADPLATFGGEEARRSFATALDEWMALTASALVGLGRRALELAVDYATPRQAFGAPIGSFQAVAHRLADAATALDGATLLSREAAWASEGDPARASDLAAMAFAFAAEAAQVAGEWSLHVHGGYGFMLEYDVQLYFRRAKGWAAVYSDPGRVYAGLGARALARRA